MDSLQVCESTINAEPFVEVLVAYAVIHASIHFLYPLILIQGRLEGLQPAQLPLGEGQNAPWTGYQSITGPCMVTLSRQHLQLNSKK